MLLIIIFMCAVLKMPCTHVHVLSLHSLKCTKHPFPTTTSKRLVIYLTATWLAQLVECRTAVREVEGLSPRLDQHSALYNIILTIVFLTSSILSCRCLSSKCFLVFFFSLLYSSFDRISLSIRSSLKKKISNEKNFQLSAQLFEQRIGFQRN